MQKKKKTYKFSKNNVENLNTSTMQTLVYGFQIVDIMHIMFYVINFIICVLCLAGTDKKNCYLWSFCSSNILY
jgi:hypothetical protein